MSSFRRQSIKRNYDAASQSAVSGENTYQELSAFASPQGMPNSVTLENVFNIMLRDILDLMNEVSASENEFHHVSERGNSRRSCRGSSQNSKENEYMEILNKKGNLVEGITAAIEKMTTSSEIPKAKTHCYQKYTALLKHRLEKSKQDVNMLIEDVKKTRQDCERLEHQVDTFTLFKDDEENTNEGGEIMQLFREAKTDLNTLLSVLYPDNVKEEFSIAMAHLTEAYMKNNNEDDQYVELSPETLQNCLICFLINDHVIIEDPANPLRYRLNMGE